MDEDREWAGLIPAPDCPRTGPCDWQPSDHLVMTCTRCGLTDHKATRALRAVHAATRRHRPQD